MELSVKDSVLLENVINPNTAEYKHLRALLIKKPEDGRSRFDKLNNVGGPVKFVLPYRGDSDSEHEAESVLPIKFSERGVFRNGAVSLAFSAADLLDLIAQASGRRRMTATLVVSQESVSLYESMASAASISSVVYYASRENLNARAISLADKLETMIFDHTTVNLPIDQLLNFAYRAGVSVVDGVFPYHVAARRGWDTVAGAAKWSYTHSGPYVTIGPDDDPSRLLKYKREDYLKFVDPSLWIGKSRQYFYEVRKCANGLATYRAVYVGDQLPPSDRQVTFKFPMCTSDDMVLVNINKALASGVFVSRSNNARELADLNKDYAIEVRKELFNSCVTYLIALQRDQDIVGNAIRYIQQHNYVDLVEGVRIIRCPSLQYADALCVAMVCALVAFDLRWSLTGKSISTIKRAVSVATILDRATFGTLGRLAWVFSTYVSDAASQLVMRFKERAAELYYGSDMIPGVCYDVYLDSLYQIDGEWHEPHALELRDREHGDGALLGDDDPFLGFFGDNIDTSAPTIDTVKTRSFAEDNYKPNQYVPNLVQDPEAVIQEAYDIALGGNSWAQLQNVAELRRVRDVNINTEFYGKIEINKDIKAPEKLHVDMPIRTATIPIGSTPLLDAIMASAKRNFNPPDLQLQTAVFTYAEQLAEEFISKCFVRNFNQTIRVAYEKDPITFNMTDYMEWLAGKDGVYRSALEAECPNELVELEMERFDTIVKKRIKPKLSTAAQHELGQPQVIVSMSKRDTAPFTSLHRQVFRRLDGALRPEYKSAGRLSDAEISQWLTDFQPHLIALDCIELDSSKYDKSQNLLARLIEAHIFVALGLDPGVNDIYQDSYVGKVSSRALGLSFMSVYQMKSGAPDTMLGNLVYNMVSAGHSLGYDNVAFMIAKGDDNVLWLNADVSASNAVAKMSHLFNLETKYVAGGVPYFSSGYILFFDSRGWFIPDPIKIAELFGESGVPHDTLHSQFESYKDRCASFTQHHDVPRVLEAAVRARLSNPHIPVVSLIDSFIAVSHDFDTFHYLKTGVRNSPL